MIWWNRIVDTAWDGFWKAARGMFGLFFDDAFFALAIMLWLLFTCSDLPDYGFPPLAQVVLLPLGLAVILIVNTTSRARKRRLKRTR